MLQDTKKCSSKTHTKPEMSFLLRFLKLTFKIPPHHVTALAPLSSLDEIQGKKSKKFLLLRYLLHLLFEEIFVTCSKFKTSPQILQTDL